MTIEHNTDEAYQEYRKLWKMAERREILTKVPLHLDIELTNHCNLRCNMCWHYKFLESQKGFMDFELYKKIIDEGVVKGVKAIKLQSRGEAMLHPKIEDAIIYAKQKGILDIHLTTNATLLDEKRWPAFLETGLDVLNLSLDPAHKDSFEQINKGHLYHEVIKNVNGLLSLKKKLDLKRPYVKIQMLQCDDIEKFQSEFIDEMSDLADEMTISPLFELVDEENSSEKTRQVDDPCSYLWQRMVINFNGKVTICCRDYNCCNIMGDIKIQTLEQIWNNEKYTQARQLHLQGMRSKIPFCAVCELY